MAVSLLSKDYATNYCKFSYDNWNEDKDSLPTLNTAGKDILSTIRSCCQGSLAFGTDGSKKVLCGNRNEWINYSTGGNNDNDDDSDPTVEGEKLVYDNFSNATVTGEILKL